MELRHGLSAIDSGNNDGVIARRTRWRMIARSLFVLVALFTLIPSVSAGIALMLGMLFALALGNPYLALARRVTPLLLQTSIVGLGAAMNLATIAVVGMQGALYTTVGVTITIVIGLALGRLLRLDRTTSTLLAAGTAICGGSAIAAVASAIRAKEHEVSLSLAVVFVLNALALFLFPWVGRAAGLDEMQFGLWSALAIHDTSSVVGAAAEYGPTALEVATTVKLARALWIVPVVFIISILWMRHNRQAGGATQSSKPWFILWFVCVAAVFTWVPILTPIGHTIADVAQRILILSLFLIGSCLVRTSLANIRLRPFIHGLTLWAIVGVGSLLAISTGWLA